MWTSLTVLAGTGGVMRSHPWIVASPLFTSLLLIFVSGRRTLCFFVFNGLGSFACDVANG